MVTPLLSATPVALLTNFAASARELRSLRCGGSAIGRMLTLEGPRWTPCSELHGLSLPVTYLWTGCSYLLTYAGIVGFVLVTYCACTTIYTFATVRAGRIVHTRLLNSVMASTFRFVVVALSMMRCEIDLRTGGLTQFRHHESSQG
jgi:hypothetical protein